MVAQKLTEPEARTMEKDDETPVTGPNVRKLLRQPLRPGESLRANPYLGGMDLVAPRISSHGTKTGGRRVVQSFATYDRKAGRSRTAEEIAADVDAWLRDREAEDQARTEKRAAEKAQAAAERTAVEALRSAVTGKPDGEVRIRVGGNLSVVLAPKPDGTWCLDRSAGTTGTLTTDEVIALVRRGAL